MSTKEHRSGAPKQVTVGIVSVSTTRSLADDKSGNWISKHLRREGHEVVFRRMVPDESQSIRSTILDAIGDISPQVILMTGGTGISRKDVTIETLRPLFDKEMTAFGPLFAQLSFEEVDSAAILSRATAGVVGNTIVFCLPGSLKACKLACKMLILPELGHLVRHALEV